MNTAKRQYAIVRSKLIPVLIVIFSSLAMLTVHSPAPTQIPEPETAQNEPFAIDRMSYWAEHPEESPADKLNSISYLAKLADSTCEGMTDDCKVAIMQCALNRVNRTGFPNTVEAVVRQPNQFPKYKNTTNPSRETRDLAKSVYDGYYGGEIYICKIPTNCVFANIKNSGIEFRDKLSSEEFTWVPNF